MGWHRCSRYWKHGATCPVRGMPAHEDEEDEDEEDEEDRPKHGIPIEIRRKRPAEPGSVVAVAEAIVREVETRQVEVPVGQPPVRVPDFVPAPQSVVVPALFPSPADVREEFIRITTAPTGAPAVGGRTTTSATRPPFVAPENPFGDVAIPVSPTQSMGSGLPSVGGKIVDGTIAAGVGVGMGIVAASPIGWAQRLVTISRILRSLQPQAGMMTLPSARSLLGAAGMAAVKTIVSRASTEPGPREVEQVQGFIEELVVDFSMGVAAQRTDTISRTPMGLPEPFMETITAKGTPHNPFGDFRDAFMQPGLFNPPAPAGGSDVPGGHGFLFDMGNFINSQITGVESRGSPPPTSF